MVELGCALHLQGWDLLRWQALWDTFIAKLGQPQQNVPAEAALAAAKVTETTSTREGCRALGRILRKFKTPGSGDQHWYSRELKSTTRQVTLSQAQQRPQCCGIEHVGAALTLQPLAEALAQDCAYHEMVQTSLGKGRQMPDSYPRLSMLPLRPSAFVSLAAMLRSSPGLPNRGWLTTCDYDALGTV